jgi:adenylate cyclase
MATPLRSHAIEVGGSRYVFLYRELAKYGSKPWIVGTYVNLDTLNAEFRRLYLAGALGIAFLAASIIAAFWLGRKISTPVRRIAVAAEAIGEFEMDKVPVLPGSMITELNQQAAAFNTMVSGLRWFDSYVPKSLVRKLLKYGSGPAIAHDDREITVLFSDIVGFSSLSEKKPAAEIAQFLNDHFRILVGCIEATGGTVDKFIGDSVMAYWGAPERDENQAEHACNAAIAIIDAIKQENRTKCLAGDKPVRIRIGIHSGVAAVGNIGSPERINYTIVGDIVNVASRIEQLGKEYSDDEAEVTVLLSGTTRIKLPKSFKTKHLGLHSVKGREEPIDVYKINVEAN